MKILITGCNGQLGTELQRQLKDGECSLGKIPEQYKNAKIVAVDIDTIDISDKNKILGFCFKEKFDIIINCAAFTNVNACETETQACFKANSLAPAYLAEAASETFAKLVHVSTDYVFAGDGETPYKEWDIPAPNTAYGKAKLLGEQLLKERCNEYFIVRTAWLYGTNGNNFVKTIMKAGKEKGEVRVVNDQLGNPTSCVDVAYHILKIAITENYGLYHCTNNGICSWYDFTKEIFSLAKIDAKVIPCSTDEYKTPAKRPAYSALDNVMLDVTVGDGMRPWKQAISEHINSISLED